MTARQLLPVALAALALGGAAMVVISSGSEGGVASGLPSPDDPHAAAGVVTAGGPEVAAAFSQRVTQVEERLRSSPDDRGLLLELARLLHDGHRAQESVAYYRRAIELDPTDAQPYYDLASVHAGLADWGAARAVLQDRLARAPTDAVAMYDMGAVEANAGEDDAAVRWWEEAQRVTDDPELRGRIQAALTQLGRAPDPPKPR